MEAEVCVGGAQREMVEDEEELGGGERVWGLLVLPTTLIISIFGGSNPKPVLIR